MSTDREDIVESKPALLTCPWCLERGHPVPRKIASITVAGHLHYVECARCEACGPTNNTEAEAIAAWNLRRTSPEAVEALKQSALQFRFYEKEHKLKARDHADPQARAASLNKAETNRRMAVMCEDALATTAGETSPEAVEDMREALEAARRILDYWGPDYGNEDEVIVSHALLAGERIVK